MIRKYEVVYIFDSVLEEAQVNSHLENFHKLLETPDNKEPVTSAEHWGKRTFAYPIDGKEAGYYVVVQFQADSTTLGEFERALKLEPAVLRYLLVINHRQDPEPTEEKDPSQDAEEAESPEPSFRRRMRPGRLVRGPLDYKDDRLLVKFITERGKIIPKRQSGLTAKQQRQLSTAIKRARHLALLPFIRGYRS